MPHPIELSIVIAIAIALGLRTVFLTMRPLLVAFVSLLLVIGGWVPKSLTSASERSGHYLSNDSRPKADFQSSTVLREPASVRKRFSSTSDRNLVKSGRSF